jgi:hypothetical protein
MSEQSTNDKGEALDQILDSAKRLGVELDEAEALQWMTAISAGQTGGDVVVDVGSGVFGHKVSMLDFKAEDLAYFRKIGELVEFEDRPGVVETALALSGSAAQSKIQTYPGDCDYFERVNIKAPTKAEACSILADLMREKVLATARGPHYQMIEVKMGSYQEEIVRGDKTQSVGAPISWAVDEIQKGKIEGFRPDGSAAEILWETAAQDPGWCKLDWVVADPVRKKLANASNMLDVTWEAPDGQVTPLDGYLDPYFQEIYLEADSIPVFSKLVKHMSPDALDTYVEQLEKEVNKYLTKDINYGKAAKRMYNVFRLTGRYEEAAFVRELFDEPATMLYQVHSLIRTIDDVVRDPGSISNDALVFQADQLILSVVQALEGDEETEIVRKLLLLRDALAREVSAQDWTRHVDTCRAEVMNLVNNFFHERLTGVPKIQAYIKGFTD